MAVMGLTACSGPYSNAPVAAKGERGPAAVEVERLASSSVPEVVAANGELVAEEQAVISTKVPGRVARLAVDLGSVVKEGDLLCELEKEDYAFRVQQAQAQVQQIRSRLALPDPNDDRVVPERTATVKEARAALEDARLVFETTERLAREGVVSKIDFERALARKQGLEARVQASLAEVANLEGQLTERKAQLELARQQLRDTVVRAPFAGAITKRTASMGEYLGVNAPVVTLVRQHPLRVRLEVPERAAARVARGQKIEIRLEGAAEVMRQGRVVRLSPAIEAQNRALVVEGELPNEDGRLRPGSFVEATIMVDAGARGITVPRTAVVSFAGILRVFTVKDGVLQERLVKTGRRFGERLEVMEGLAEGEVLVTKATDRMTKGQRVTTAGPR